MSIWLSTTFATLSIAAFVVATMWIGFSVPLFLFTFVVAGVFILQTPLAGLLSIILLTMVFERFFTLQPFSWGEYTYKIYSLDFLFLITIGAIGVQWVFGNNRVLLKAELPLGSSASRNRIFPPDYFVFFFIGIVAASAVGGLWFEAGNADLIVSALKNYGFYAALYFLVRLLTPDWQSWKTIVHAFFIGGVAILFFIIVGFARGQGLWSEYTPLSTSGYRFLASTHAYYLTIPLLTTLILYSYGRIRETFRVGGLMAVQLLGIIGSLMRHIWIASLAAAFVAAAVMDRAPRLIFLRIVLRTGLIVAALVAFLFVGTLIAPTSRLATVLPEAITPFIERVTSLFHSSQDLSTAWRIDVWRTTAQSFVRHPFLGIGFGHDMTFERENYHLTIDIREVHNSPLAILVQMGLLGFVAFVAMLVALVRGWWRAYRAAAPDRAPYLLGIGASALLFFIASLFQPYLETNTTGIFFWIILGLMASGQVVARRA